jgi:hypothetical protein
MKSYEVRTILAITVIAWECLDPAIPSFLFFFLWRCRDHRASAAFLALRYASLGPSQYSVIAQTQFRPIRETTVLAEMFD